MKFVVILLVIFCPFFKKEQKYFELFEATYVEWVAGANGGGKGINYELKLQIKSNNIAFDSAWVNESRILCEVAKGKARNYKKPILKGDTIIIRFTEAISDKSTDNKESTTEISKVSAPIKYEGKALISYYLNKKKHYYIVEKFEKKQAPYNK